MKVRKFCLGLGIFLMLQSTTSFALTYEQFKELFWTGVLTLRSGQDGDKLGYFKVNYIPGADNIMLDAAYHRELAEQDFRETYWRDDYWDSYIKGMWRGGIDFAKSSVQKADLGAIPQDFEDMLLKDVQARHQFGLFVIKMANFLEFMAKAAGRIGEAGLGGAAGISAGAGSAAAMAVGPLVLTSTRYAIPGFILPIMLHIWNMTASMLSIVYVMPNTPGSTALLTWIPASETENNDDKED